MFKAGRGRSSASSSLTMKKIKFFFILLKLSFSPFLGGGKRGRGEGVYTLLIVSTEWGLNGFRASFQELLVAIPDSRPLLTRILTQGKKQLTLSWAKWFEVIERL